MVEEQWKRVEDHLTKISEEIDKSALRKMQVFLCWTLSYWTWSKKIRILYDYKVKKHKIILIN